MDDPTRSHYPECCRYQWEVGPKKLDIMTVYFIKTDKRNIKISLLMSRINYIWSIVEYHIAL